MGHNWSMDTTRHDAEIQDQFTRQAEPFAQRHASDKGALLATMAACAGVRADDAVLDVACGPGIVSCFFAKRAGEVTGLDVVPAMLERARRTQAEQGVTNVAWKLGSATELPFAAETFDCVVTRFSFHHFLEPEVALGEMKRVCRPGGRIVVCDVAPSEETQESFNRWERLRDPSHTRALTEAELRGLGDAAGLEAGPAERCSVETDIEELLTGSFPKEGDEERIRALFAAEIEAGTSRLGVAVRQEAGVVRITYPMVVMSWRK